MPGRGRLAWKLSAVTVAMVVLILVASGLVGSFLSRHYAQETARTMLHFSAVSIRSGIRGLMMTRDNPGVREFVQGISRGSDLYQELRLVSHPSGEIAASRLPPPAGPLTLEHTTCAVCHVGEDPPEVPTADPLDQVLIGKAGERYLQVVTPILNEPGCKAGDCHAHAESPPVLGFLQAEYSLGSVDALLGALNLFLALAAAVAVVLVTGLLMIVFQRSLGRPLRQLQAGMRALAADGLTFRFPAQRDDEIGLIESTFNQMAERIQKREGQLENALEYLEGIVENSADLIITVNPEGCIQTFNRGAEAALGYDRDEVIGQRIEMLFADPGERDAAIAELREGDNVTNYQARFTTKAGEIRHVLLTLSRLRNKQGEPIGTFGISKDVTTEKDLQHQLAQAEQAAAIGRAVTGIQHAIKNMLNTLRGGLYVARVGVKNESPQQMEEGFDMIDVGLARIGGLSRNLLKYAREWKIEPEPTDLGDLVQQVVAAVGQTAEQQGVTLRTEVAEDLPVVSCDPNLMHMGLMDFVSNAMDAVLAQEYDDGDGAEIVLRAFAEPDGEAVALEVQDNGVGMTPEVIEHVFTPFFSTKPQWGTGLGLALTARIIELHGGAINVESQPDRGATFRITLPHGRTGTDRREADGQEDPRHRR
jgi:PAS domain S-box-containing protein